MNPIKKNTPNNNEIRNLIAFTAIGIAMSLNSILLLAYFIGLNIFYFYRYFITLNIFYLIQLLFFLPSVELSRRVLGVGIMPYEFGKYLCFFYFIIFSLDKRIHTKKISTIFLILFLFIFPSTLFMDMANFQKKIVFSLLGIMNLSLLGIFFSRITITSEQLKSIYRNFIFSAIPFLVIITLKSPKLSEISFDLGANHDASGGFGPNQVSTFFGATIFIIVVYRIVFKSLLFDKFKPTDIFLMIGFALRALLTFSRGGIFAPIAAFLMPINILSKVQNIQQIIKNFLLIGFFATTSFILVNLLTGGLLLSRYKGETAGTIARSEETTLEEATSGRVGIVENDFQIWLDNFVFGVGPGESPDYRDYYNFTGNKVTHTEFSRLLAEHGLFGVVINLILIVIIPYKIVRSKIRPQVKYIKLAFVLFALFSMAHSAMRTIIPVIFYAFSAINIDDRKKAKDKVELQINT